MINNLGLVSVTFRKNTPEEILIAMKDAGLSYIEWGSDVHAPKDDLEFLNEIVSLQNKYGIKCCSYGTYFRLGSTNVAELTDYISAAKILGTNILRLWCGNKNSQDYTAKEKEKLFAECKMAANIAEKSGVILCMECHINTFTNKKESALELMKFVDSKNFRMYWQPNQCYSEEENLQSARLLSPYTVNLHVFNWTKDKKLPLADAKDIWQKYISCFNNDIKLLLEFMPDGKIESLKTETETLRGIAK